MTTDLTLVQDHNGQPMTTSLVVAQVFGKMHKDVLKAIEKLVEEDVRNFAPMSYLDSYGRSQRMYLMDRDAFTLLAMGFTGSSALEWKKKYIHAFNEMETRLTTPMSALDILKNQVVVMEEHEKRLDTVDTRLDSHDDEIKALKHKTSTLGVPLNGISVKQAHEMWGEGMTPRPLMRVKILTRTPDCPRRGVRDSAR